MVTQPPGQGQPGLGKAFEQFTGFPSPEKVLYELQRLNNNMETLQPDLHRLATSLDGLRSNDIQNLTAALHGFKVGDMIRTLNEVNRLGRQIYDRLWGKL